MTRVVEGVGKEAIRHPVPCSEQLHVYESALQKDLLKDAGMWSKMPPGAFFVRAEMGNELDSVHRGGAGLRCRSKQMTHASCVHDPLQYDYSPTQHELGPVFHP